LRTPTSCPFLMRVVSVGLVLVILCAAMPTKATALAEAGISTSATLLRMNDQDLNRRLTDVQHMGATWIRIDFSWPAIQPDSANVYHWGMYDRIVRIAGVHHLKILAVLDYTPGWAQEHHCADLVKTWAARQKCNPAHDSMFGRFARAAALRYEGKNIRAWEIWNEPNISSYWKVAQQGSAVLTDSIAYAKLANTAALQIRRNDPGTIIVTGGLGPEFHPAYPKGISQGDFLAQILPYLNPALFDAVGIHPYSWPALPSTKAIYNAFYTVNHGPPGYDLRRIMVRAGWGDKQIWGTEFGAPTKGLSRVTTVVGTSRPDHVTEHVQAQIIAQGIRYWYAIPNAGPLFIQSDSDQWLPQIKNNGGFGLRRLNGSEKPSYDAFKDAILNLHL
jgi:polysaccharide biosynthesis protein PslG